ncbi:MAG: hypothetical protein ACO3UM_19835 [Planctomycetota bacterium]
MLYSLKSLMWREVGLVRAEGSLAEAVHRIGLWNHYLERSAQHGRRAHELQNMLLTSALIAIAARERTESRGTHFRSDHPTRDDAGWCGHLTLRRGADGEVLVERTEIEAPTDAPAAAEPGPSR